MTSTRSLFRDDGTVDADKVATLRRGDLMNAVDDLEQALREAKESDDGSAKARRKRTDAATQLREFRRWQRDNGIGVDPDAVNITPDTIASTSTTMNQEA